MSKDGRELSDRFQVNTSVMQTLASERLSTATDRSRGFRNSRVAVAVDVQIALT
jgi:hypothetical protein